MQAWPITFSSSRTLPGQLCSDSRICARCVRPWISLAVLRGEPGDEMPLQQRQILLALRQARHLDLHHRKPVIQILAKMFFGDGGAQIVIGGRDHAHIHLARGQRSHALHFLVLQHAQQLGLRRQRHVADFVQEQRAAVSVFEQSGFIVRRAGERPPHVAE